MSEGKNLSLRNIRFRVKACGIGGAAVTIDSSLTNQTLTDGVPIILTIPYIPPGTQCVGAQSVFPY